ncbi:hypothetical protein FPZ12_017700 [Amycolatopsis acidicola]|uniref:Uncharacterized protein n=1 Tax=Amycolatopsis acidicola TaxID=2596893 RepID=A0A5N0V478_9PSEU|nr:hypothetical protein [Amycolatopsis acidicola]KAA9160188.1 hypothetical protein FPZ12_017700 [Amycolatopsis acidicola]
MAAGLFFFFTVLAAIVAVFVPSVRRWVLTRRHPVRAVGLTAVVWLVVLITLAATSSTSPPPSTNAAASAVPTTTTAAPTTTTSTAPVQTCHAGNDNGKPLPDTTCTPGATNPVVTASTLDSTICATGWADTVRPSAAYTDELKVQQIAAYGYADVQAADYVEDHLIPLELGGNPTDSRNLWPEPGTGQAVAAKDAVESALNRAVCGHRITLTAAQQAIAANWSTAETVLGLDAPVSTPATTAPSTTKTKAKATTTAEAPAPVEEDTSAADDPLAGRYRAGEFCSKSNLGVSTIATNGATITCVPDGSRYRWKA